MSETEGPEALLHSARGGDVEARGRLLGLYRNYLGLLARVQVGRQLQAKADPSDVVQEAFLAAHRDFDTFKGATEAELMGWLRRLLAARLADLGRRFLGARRRDARLERELEDGLDRSSRALQAPLAARGPSPSEAAARREQAVLLADALAALPADYREVIVMRHLEGLTFPEVAARMGRSTGGAEKLWVRALVQLRRHFGEGPG